MGRGSTAGSSGEADTPADPQSARTRATGGVPEPEAKDTHSTTGTTPSETFVGRASGDDAGEPEQSGAEARAEHGDDDPPAGRRGRQS